MSKDNSKLQELLEWWDYMDNYSGEIMQVELHHVKDKIKSLISEATDDKSSTVDPSEWQVGDLVTDGQNYVVHLCHEADGGNWFTEMGEELRVSDWSNIDAERRALQAEIDALKGATNDK